MKILVLNQPDVERLLPMGECINVMEQTFIALARNEVDQPLRTIFKPSSVKGVMALMPSFRGGAKPLFGLKAICVFPGNAAVGKDAHQGGVLLFDGTTGELMALIDASSITAIRTAAVSGLATRALANREAANLAIIGAGVQARAHLEAMACARPIKSVRVAARRFESAEAFAREMQARHQFSIQPAQSAEAAVDGADIIVTATTAREPVVKREWIASGAHINAIGTFSPKAREIDSQTMKDALLFVDRRESAFNEAGDYLIAASEGVINEGSIAAELGEVLIDAHPGRTSAEQITLFKSLGLAIEDLAAAEYVFERARETQTGVWTEFGGA